MTTEASALSDLLTQEEIDVLLTNDKKDLSRLVKMKTENSLSSQIQKSIDSFSHFLVPKLQKLTQADNVVISLHSTSVFHLGTYLDTQNNASVIGIYSFKQIRQSFLISLDCCFAYTLIDMCLGGRRGTAALQTTNRPYTQIEKNIIHTFFTTIEQNLSDSFEQSVNFENLNTTPQTALIASPACDVTIVRFQVTIDKRTSFFDLIVPQHIISQINQQETPSDSSDDAIAQALLNVPITLKAVLDKKQIPFSQILKWKKGDSLNLSYFDAAPLELMCSNTLICKASLHVDKKMFYITVERKKDL